MRPLLNITAYILLVWLAACSLQPPPKNDWLAEAPKYSQDANNADTSVLADVGEVHNGYNAHSGSHSGHR